MGRYIGVSDLVDNVMNAGMKEYNL